MKISSLNDLPATDKYLKRINAEPRTMMKAVVREEHGTGYWRDVTEIRFDKKGSVSTEIAYAPTDEEAEAIALEFAKLEWPEHRFIDLDDENMPSLVTNAAKENVFRFKNENGKIIMLQVRLDKRDGKKAYIPVTKWSDGEFRFLEPEGKLPLYGLENIKGATTVLIVEGAKTARYVQWLSDGATQEAIDARNAHPFGKELTNICVLGWCSGALSPYRTDWSPIAKNGITRAYIALDNDDVGRAALPPIAKQLRCVTHSLEFTDDWPTAADLYDPFPEKFFREIDGKRYYIGPSWNDLTHPATWMTDVFPNPDDPKKNIIQIRNHARSLWHFVEETQEFIYLEKPEIIRKSEVLDATLKPFSDAKKTSELLLSVFNGRMTSFDYCPYTTKRKIIHNGRPVINLYTPSNIRPQEGNVKPFLEFVEYLIPDEKERYQVLRWCATLIARPDIRMLYALLLISAETGTGKSTLLWILQEIVGRHNSATPTEKVVAGEFNSWLSGVRCVGVHEIYAGASFKMFNQLKDLITEPVISVRRMYRDPVDMSNWSQFILCSNSLEALKIDEKDRRIFAPTVTEKRWPDEKFDALRDWLESGGFSIVAWWAKNWTDYVKKAEKAPMTGRKLEMIENSRSEANTRVEDLARTIMERHEPIAIGDKTIKQWLIAICKDKVYESPLGIRKEMRRHGVIEITKDHIGGDGRLSYNSQMQTILCNKIAIDKLHEISDIGRRKELLRQWLTRPGAVMTFEE